MNAQSKSPISGVTKKVVLAVGLVAGLMAILSGVLFNVDQSITVQSRAGEVTVRQGFSSLPEYGYIMAHSLQPREVTVKQGFSSLPEYGYIQAHIVWQNQK